MTSLPSRVLGACASLLAGLAAGAPPPSAAPTTPAPVSVAVYQGSLGAKAIHKTLAADQRFRSALIKTITTDVLLQHDVLLVGNCSLDQPDQVRGLRTFLACGGGLILNHAACGRYRPDTLFPAVVKKVADRRDDSVLRVRDAAHPLAAGLPAEYEHAFNDHLYLEPGPDGTVVIEDREGAPVVVAGTVGAGRVVFNGSLPGYWYNPADYAQGEKEPEGAERQWVYNAVLWAAGAPRLTALPPEELAARRAKAEADIKLDELTRNLPSTNWFGQEMLRGAYMALPPVTELGGRFFITYDSMSWRHPQRSGDLGGDEAALREFVLARLKLDILQMKWLGVTDIIYWIDMGGERVFHPTRVPDSVVQTRGMDVLAELIRLATPEGVNVWAAWHSCSRSEDFAKKYCARNAKGDFYLYQKGSYVEDLLNPAYLDRCRAMLDEYAEVYKPMGNFKGLLTYDELWFTYADFHEDDLPVMDAFCRERFGEGLPPDFAQRLAQKTRWNDPTDPWRRRYLLFKQKVITDFFAALVQHAHRRGLQMGVTTLYIPGKWSFGMDSVELGRLGADYLIGGGAYSNALRWTHTYDSWGHYNTANLRGGPGGLMFTFNHLWRLIMFGNDPQYARQFARHVYDLRLFADAQPLTRVAFLDNDRALEMLAPAPKVPWNRVDSLVRTVRKVQDARRVFSRATELLPPCRVVVATPYSTRGLPEAAWRDLRHFVEEGGTAVSIDADWSTAREDMANERFRTAEMAGVTYGAPAPPAPASFPWQGGPIAIGKDTPRRAAVPEAGTKVLAAFADGAPAVTEKPLGKGRVIGLHFDAGAELSQNENPALANMLNALLREAAAPPVVLESDGALLNAALHKGNWVAAALYADRPPAEAVVRVDLEALGIAKTRFRVLLLGKQMDIARPGDLWGSQGFWTPADLKRGVRVTVTEDQTRYLPLPEAFDFSDFKGKKGDQRAEYADTITRSWWDSEKRGKQKRTYSHEIVVIAPADEPAMPKP